MHAGSPHDPSEYGSHIAGDYDAIYGGAFDTEAAVKCLTGLAGTGPVLEFGVGTGRVAIPLSQAGLEVHGIDGSQKMLSILASKPRGDLVRTSVGDFAESTVGRVFSLVLLLVNTIYALLDQRAQLRCFANAARHLAPGGRFVIEAWVPDPPAHDHRRIRPRPLGDGYVGLVIEENDPAAQVLTTTQLVFSDGGPVRVFPVVHRYAWPSELDLMAELSGLALEHRWGDWRAQPFGAQSKNHISVWRRD